jgi:hypothetical protein
MQEVKANQRKEEFKGKESNQETELQGKETSIHSSKGSISSMHEWQF